MSIKLIHGNCLELMKEIPDKSIDTVICDPPYGTTDCAWDSIIPLDEMWNELNRIIKPSSAVLLFGQQPFTSVLTCSNLKNYKYDLYWEKERITNIQQVKKRAGKVIETISLFYSKQCTYNPQMQIHNGPKRTNKVKEGKLGKLTDSNTQKVIEYNDTGLRYPTQLIKFKRDILTCNLHPTQKPLALMEYLVKTYSNKGDTVLDFTMGSGTTGVACVNTNRNFIGIEKDDLYFEIAQKRIQEAILKKGQNDQLI